jgi:hypothetical protein
MWCLDTVNSAELINRLRPHGRDGDFAVAWIGEGWRTLVEACHDRLITVFPEYELLAINGSTASFRNRRSRADGSRAGRIGRVRRQPSWIRSLASLRLFLRLCASGAVPPRSFANGGPPSSRYAMTAIRASRTLRSVFSEPSVS